MISMSDFKNSDGKIDWKAYKAAEVESGKRCYRCGRFQFGRDGRSLCGECARLDSDDGSVEHDSIIRCPHCDNQENIQDEMHWSGEFRCYEEGHHSWECSACEEGYEITTRVSYSFESPPRSKKMNDTPNQRGTE